MLWRKDELKEIFGLDAEASGVSIDTRSLQKDDLFFGLTGDNGVDGMEFAGTAREKGASGVLAGLDHLQKLALAARERSTAKRIAVTGSVGKTTTKELLAQAFGVLGRTHAAPSSFNNHIGVPLTLARMPQDTEYAIFELGMNRRGEIAPLTQIVQPHVAMITTIAPVHLEHLETLHNIAEEKADVFLGLAPNGVAILPADSDHTELLKERAGAHRILTFGTNAKADLRLLHSKTEADGVRFTADIAGERLDLFLPHMGAHIALNAIAAMGAVHALDGDLHQAAEALTHYKPMTGRGVRFTHKGVAVLDESYNASPISVTATLQNLAVLPCKGQRVAILGDMLELGPEGPELHRMLAETVHSLPIDTAVTCGPLMRNLHDALPPAKKGPHFDTADEAAAEIKNLVKAEDCVLIKGSNGMKMTRIVEAIRQL